MRFTKLCGSGQLNGVIDVEVVIKKLADLKHVPGNTRLHSEEQISEYVRSIKMFGQLRPMVIDENNIVLAGNGLLEALRKMGRTTAACYVVAGLTDSEKQKLSRVSERIFNLSEDDLLLGDEIICPHCGSKIHRSK